MGEKMDTFEINFHLPFKIKKENDWYISSCHILDVHSQGKTKKQAENNLSEALFLFLFSCIERGTIDSVLKDCGFELDDTPTKKRKRVPHLDVSIPFGIRESQVGCHA